LTSFRNYEYIGWTNRCGFDSYFFLKKNKKYQSVRVGAKTDFREIVSPTDRTDIGRQILFRLPAAGSRWWFGVGAVTANRRPVGGRRLIYTVLTAAIISFEDLCILLIKDHEYKVVTSQSIMFCKITVTCYEVT